MPLTFESQARPKSEAMEEMIGGTPGGIVRWGMPVIFSIIAMLVGVSFIVQYRDVVNATLTITASNAPKSVIAKTDGKLVRLMVHEKAAVEKGDVLAYLESTADHEDVLRLATELDKYRSLASNNNWEALQQLVPHQYSRLGELQEPYYAFLKSYILLDSYIGNGLYTRKKALLHEELKNNDALKERLEAQEQVHRKDFEIASKDFSIKETLYHEKVLAMVEYDEEQSKLLNKQLPLENIKSDVINNSIAAAEKRWQLLQVEQDLVDRKNEFIQSLYTLINDINKWKTQYLLQAPVSGHVAFTAVLTENQDVKNGEELMYVTQPNGSFFGEMQLAQENLGKVGIGQEVMIKLPSYPYQEYGQLRGHITFISSIPNKDQKFVAKVSLPDGLITDYGKQLDFRNALSADAEVVTSKTRLCNKFLYTLRSIWSKTR